MARKKKDRYEVSGGEVVKKVKEIIKEGHARRIIILSNKGARIMEFPLTVGVVGVVLAPLFAALGALTALATKCTIVVEKR